MSSFESFDPLSAKQQADTEVAAIALKKEIQNILSSYVGWYDPFSELIQNSLDSIDEKKSSSGNEYIPTISILINIKKNYLCVSDNGTGLDEKKFKQFLVPNFSFKSGNTRGYKGVGATYLAYGFNYIHISTKTEDYKTSGKMMNARNWLSDKNPSGNPEIIYDNNAFIDNKFNEFESGVSICLKFDNSTHPKALNWIKANTAEQWKIILLTKTGLGSFFKTENMTVNIKVIDTDDSETELSLSEINYYWPHQITTKYIDYNKLQSKVDTLYTKNGADFRLPSEIKNIESIYGYMNSNEICELPLSDEELEFVKEFRPTVYFAYLYTAKKWKAFNDALNIRKNHSILMPGIQICANNMPQGEIIQIPLNRNTGRQNQMSVVIHFDNCEADLGRKGFQPEVVSLSKRIGQRLIENISKKYKRHLRVNSGVPSDLIREQKVDTWKKEIEEHEKNNPISLINKNFFKPINNIAITSIPTREQDVIALFNQLIAGGVIRGIKIMSTNERFVYDGMYRISYTKPDENHRYDETTNPLGVDDNFIDEYSGFTSTPKILEYKYNLDALIEDISNGNKNSNDINLVIVWEVGTDYQGSYEITSTLDPDNLALRQYHGVTHVMTNLENGQREMELIVLEDLVNYLNNPEDEISKQRDKYA